MKTIILTQHQESVPFYRFQTLYAADVVQEPEVKVLSGQFNVGDIDQNRLELEQFQRL